MIHSFENLGPSSADTLNDNAYLVVVTVVFTVWLYNEYPLYDTFLPTEKIILRELVTKNILWEMLFKIMINFVNK